MVATLQARFTSPVYVMTSGAGRASAGGSAAEAHIKLDGKLRAPRSAGATCIGRRGRRRGPRDRASGPDRHHPARAEPHTHRCRGQVLAV